MAVLRDLLRAGSGRQRRCSFGLLAIHFHLVPATFGDGAGFRNGGVGSGRDDPAGGGAKHYQPLGLESGLRCARLYRLAAVCRSAGATSANAAR